MRIAPQSELSEIGEGFGTSCRRQNTPQRETAERMGDFDVQQIWSVHRLTRAGDPLRDPLRGSDPQHVVDHSRRVENDHRASRCRRITRAEDPFSARRERRCMRSVSSSIVGRLATCSTSASR